LYPGGSDRDPEACPALDCSRAVLDPLDPLTWSAARRAAREGGSDAWILPYWTWAWAGLWWYLLRDRDRPPVVAVVHNPVDHDAHGLHRLAARTVLGRCRGLFTHARVLAADLERAYPGIPVTHHRLPAAVPAAGPNRAAARAALGLDGDRRVALFLGLIRPYKGVDLLIRAAADLAPDSDWLVVVAGEPWGGLGARLERQIAELEIEDRVRLDLRWIPEDEVAVLLAAADVVVLPYRRGSQSALAPMALAHGVPVVTTAVGGVPEVVEDGISGVVVPPGDPAALTDALNHLDPDRLAALADGARRSAEGLSYSAYAAELETLVRRVVGASRDA
jgi:glycosyltransferase involved in cell wall biosynthesis